MFHIGPTAAAMPVRPRGGTSTLVSVERVVYKRVDRCEIPLERATSCEGGDAVNDDAEEGSDGQAVGDSGQPLVLAGRAADEAPVSSAPQRRGSRTNPRLASESSTIRSAMPDAAGGRVWTGVDRLMVCASPVCGRHLAERRSSWSPRDRPVGGGRVGAT
jgi:hypothetical protein